MVLLNRLKNGVDVLEDFNDNFKRGIKGTARIDRGQSLFII